MPGFSIVREQLLEAGFSTFNAGRANADVRALRYPTSADDMPDIHDILFVDDANADIAAGWGPIRCRTVICAGESTAARMAGVSPKSCILLAPQGVSAPAAQQAVWSVLADYEAWVQRALRSALRSDNLSRFLAIIGEKVVNPLAVFDSDFNILGYSETARDLPEGTVWDSFTGSQFRVADFYDARERADISRAMEGNANKEILFHPRRDQSHTYYSGLLRVNAQNVGCIGIADVFAPLTDGQIELARVARELLEGYLSRNQRTLLLDDASRGLWFDLITGQTVEEGRLQEALAERGWRYDERYAMMSFIPAGPRRSSIELTAALHQIAAELPLARVAVKGQEITALMRAADYGSTFCANPSGFLEQSGLYAGASFELPNLSHCATAFRQSTYAAKCARKLKIHFVEYPTVLPRHAIETLARSVPLETFYHPRIAELAKSPKESDRALVPCLRAYLLNGRNVAETARSLNLHRNTVIYRIRKLSELLDVDFDAIGDQELFGLLMSADICLARWPE